MQQQDLGGERSSAETPPKRGWLGQPQLLFPAWHLGLLFVSMLDLSITRWVLDQGGHEVNWFADLILNSDAGWHGMVLYKFALVTLFIILCEEIGRRRRVTGKRVAVVGILISALPMILVPVQLALHQEPGVEQAVPGLERKLAPADSKER